MNSKNAHSQIKARRAELMAELFLQELGPKFLSRPTTADVGYDLLVGFANKRGGINTFAIAVVATERAPGAAFELPRHTLDRFTSSNIPGLLLVVDVKHNTIYYAWLTSEKPARGADILIALVELNDETTKELRAQFEAPTTRLATAG